MGQVLAVLQGAWQERSWRPATCCGRARRVRVVHAAEVGQSFSIGTPTRLPHSVHDPS